MEKNIFLTIESPSTIHFIKIRYTVNLKEKKNNKKAKPTEKDRMSL
jgi:hypothetical protein